MDLERDLPEEGTFEQIQGVWEMVMYGPLSLLVKPVGLMVILFIGLVISADRVESKVQSMPQFETRQTFSQIKFPNWLSQYAVDQLGKISLEKNVFSPQLVSTIVYHVKQLPWVRKVIEVKRGFPARITLKLAMRKPVAWTNIYGKKYMLDRTGYPVPIKYYAPNLELPEITGLVGKNGKISRSALSRKLQHGAQVAESLREYKVLKYLPVDKIDVQNVDGVLDPRDSEVKLIIKHLRLEWGRSILSQNPIRISVKSKVLNLKKLLEKAPQLNKIKVARLQFEGMVPVEFRSPEESENKK